MTSIKTHEKIMLISTLIFYSLIFSIVLSCTSQHKKDNLSESTAVKAILSRIASPDIPLLEFNLLDFGSNEEVAKDIKPALDKVIEKCSNKGGGKIIIPEGKYFSKGPIHLLRKIHIIL